MGWPFRVVAERGASDPPLCQRLDKRCLFDELAASDVDQHRIVFHCPQSGSIDDTTSLVGKWRREHQVIERSQCIGQFTGGPNLARFISAGVRLRMAFKKR